MTTAPPVRRVLMVLSPSPVRRILRDWLTSDGYEVSEAAPWDVDRIVDSGGARVVVTSDDLDGEWEWSQRHATQVLVLSLPPAPRA